MVGLWFNLCVRVQRAPVYRWRRARNTCTPVNAFCFYFIGLKSPSLDWDRIYPRLSCGMTADARGRWLLLFSRRPDRADGRAQAANGGFCHANFHLGGHGLPLLSSLAEHRYVGSSAPCALRAGPPLRRTSSLSFGGDHGWPIGQDDGA